MRKEKEEADTLRRRRGKRDRPPGEKDQMEREPERTKPNVEDDEALTRRLQKELEEHELQNSEFPVDVDVEAQQTTLEQMRLEKEKRDIIAKEADRAAQAVSESSKFNPLSVTLFLGSLAEEVTEADLRRRFKFHRHASSVHLSKNNNGAHKGYAYIFYSTVR